MKVSKISLVASVFIAGSLLFTGCGGSNSSTAATDTTDTYTADANTSIGGYTQIGTTGVWFDMDYGTNVNLRGLKVENALTTFTDVNESNSSTFVDYNITASDTNLTAMVLRLPVEYNNTNAATVFSLDLNTSDSASQIFKIKLNEDANDDKIIKYDSDGTVHDPYVADANITKSDGTLVGRTNNDGRVEFTDNNISDNTILYTVGGTDLATGGDFNTSMKTVYLSGQDTIFTPLTSLMVDFATDGNDSTVITAATIAAAKTSLGAFLGIDASIVDKDPQDLVQDTTQPAKAEDARKAIKKAIQVQKVINQFKDVADGSSSAKAKSAIKAVTKAIKTASTSGKKMETSTSWITDVNASDLRADGNTSMISSVAKIATVVNKKIEDTPAANLTTAKETNKLAKSAEAVAQVAATIIKDSIANGTDINDAGKVVAIMPSLSKMVDEGEDLDTASVIASTVAARTDMVNKFTAVENILKSVSSDINASENPDIVAQLVKDLEDQNKTVTDVNSSQMVDAAISAVDNATKTNSSITTTTTNIDKTVAETATATAITTNNTNLIVNTKPMVTLATKKYTIKSGTSVILKPSIYDLESNTVTLLSNGIGTITDANGTANSAGKYVKLTAATVVSNTVVTVTITGNDGNKTSDNLDLNITQVPDYTPTITATSPVSFNLDNKTLTIPVAFADQNGDTITYTATMGSDTAKVSPASGTIVNGTTNFQVSDVNTSDDTNLTLTITATDGVKTATDKVITISAYKNDAPTVDTNSTVKVDNLDTQVITVTVTDADFGKAFPTDKNVTLSVTSVDTNIKTTFTKTTFAADGTSILSIHPQYEAFSGSKTTTITITATDKSGATATKDVVITTVGTIQELALSSTTSNITLGGGTIAATVADSGALTLVDAANSLATDNTVIVRPNTTIDDFFDISAELNTTGITKDITVEGDIAIEFKLKEAVDTTPAGSSIVLYVKNALFGYKDANDSFSISMVSGTTVVEGINNGTPVDSIGPKTVDSTYMITQSGTTLNLDINQFLTLFNSTTVSTYKAQFNSFIQQDANYTLTMVLDTDGAIKMPYTEKTITTTTQSGTVDIKGPAIFGDIKVDAQAYAPNLDINTTSETIVLEAGNYATASITSSDSVQNPSTATIDLTITQTDSTIADLNDTYITNANGTLIITPKAKGITVVTVKAQRNGSDEYTEKTINVSVVGSLLVDATKSFVYFKKDDANVTAVKNNESVSLVAYIGNNEGDPLQDYNITFTNETNSTVMGYANSGSNGVALIPSFIKQNTTNDVNISIKEGSVLLGYAALGHTNTAPVLGQNIPGINNLIINNAMTNSDLSMYFSDVDGDTMTFTAANLPAGLTLDTNGTLHGTPTAEGNTTNIIITATDSASASVASNEFNIYVGPNPFDGKIVITDNNLTATGSAPLIDYVNNEYGITASPVPGETVDLSKLIIGLPSGYTKGSNNTFTVFIKNNGTTIASISFTKDSEATGLLIKYDTTLSDLITITGGNGDSVDLNLQ